MIVVHNRQEKLKLCNKTHAKNTLPTFKFIQKTFLTPASSVKASKEVILYACYYRSAISTLHPRLRITWWASTL